MLYKCNSAQIRGVDPLEVSVEVSLSSRGLPYFDIIGLGNKELTESRLRIKTAFSNCGIKFPDKKIVVNLSPADVRKSGTNYDIAIAMCIFLDILNITIYPKLFAFGELSLDGTFKTSRGTYIFGLHTLSSLSSSKVLVPLNSAPLLSQLSGEGFTYVSDLHDLKRFILSGFKNTPNKITIQPNIKLSNQSGSLTFDDIVGQETAKRALLISIAGGHNILLIGPPGVGKTMLAKGAHCLMPALNGDDMVEVNKIYSIYSQTQQLEAFRPFRSPHHSISYSGMVGGGVNSLPGELTLAHKGILFMDEFSLYRQDVLDSLRQPLEDKKVVLRRVTGNVTFPANFTLIAASNPCPCGYYGFDNAKCSCTESQISKYRAKISGPISDRLDLVVRVSRPSDQTILQEVGKGQNSIQKLVRSIELTQKIQFKRSGCLNADISASKINLYCRVASVVKELLLKYINKNNLSLRLYHKVLKVARTISDIDGYKDIKEEHVLEAISYR